MAECLVKFPQQLLFLCGSVRLFRRRFLTPGLDFIDVRSGDLPVNCNMRFHIVDLKCRCSG